MHTTTAEAPRTAPPALQNTPTYDSYGELDQAYAYFNDVLFGSELPPCLITLHRHKKAYGYFAPRRFEHTSGKRYTDEIALNPDHFKERSAAETLSTLVHEMAHLWQQHFGKPSRSNYHNREWGSKMDWLGLPPSSTGAPGGKRTGQRVSHWIEPGGRFAVACERILAQGLVIAWHSIPNGIDLKKKAGKRTKYVCPQCEAAVWGKSGLNIACGDCEVRMPLEIAGEEESGDD